jgi:hypothetical protein
MSNSDIIDAMSETAHDLGLSQVTIKEIETLGFSEVKELAPEIKAMQLTALHTAQCIEDMDLPGYNLHQLIGE